MFGVRIVVVMVRGCVVFYSEGRKELKFTDLVGRRKVRVKFWVEVSWPELLRSEYDYIHVHATMSTISAIHDHNMVRAFKLGSYHFREKWR